jgi:hypothetical protein
VRTGAKRSGHPPGFGGEVASDEEKRPGGKFADKPLLHKSRRTKTFATSVQDWTSKVAFTVVD